MLIVVTLNNNNNSSNNLAFSIDDAQDRQLMYFDSSGRIQIPPILLSHFYDSVHQDFTVLRILASLNCTQTPRLCENED